MPLKFKSLPDSAIYLNVPESEIVALAAGGVLPVHFRHYGRAGLFALVGSDCLTTVPSSDYIEAGIYRSMFNPMVLREAPMEVYLPTTAMLPVDPPRSVPVGQIMARVDEISRELDNSDIESSRWLFLVADLDEVAKALAPTTPEYQGGSTQPAGTAAESEHGDARQEAGWQPKDHEQELADLFDPVKKEQLETMFPAGGKWTQYANYAPRNGLKAARVGRGAFNPFLAARWWIDTQGPAGWSWEMCLRKLAKNLPSRSRDSKHMLTDDFE